MENDAVGLGSVSAEDPALTIYNGGFAVVRHTLALDLPAGLSEIQYAGTTRLVEPDSVILRDPTGIVPFQVLEQNYRNDPVSQDLLLLLHEGETIEFVVQHEQKANAVVYGRIIRSGYVPGDESIDPIIEVDGKLQFSLPGEPRFPMLGTDSQLKPTLTWKVSAPAAARLEAEVAYITTGLSWHASYNLTAQEDQDGLDMVGWITFKNESGAAFPEARIKLMAGDVVKNMIRRFSSEGYSNVEMYAREEPVVVEKAFDEFHLYTLGRRTTLRDKEVKQVEFMRASGIKTKRLYIYDGANISWYEGKCLGKAPHYGVSCVTTVRTIREFSNSKGNQLGIPLPGGTVRFYQEDGDGQLEFTGEANLLHTPANELLSISAGNSFDLAGERNRVEFEVDTDNKWLVESFEIRLRNHKNVPVEIRVVEHLYRDTNWEITGSSRDFEETNVQTIEFDLPVKPDVEEILTYSVKYTW